jgi:hypothetical protein
MSRRVPPPFFPNPPIDYQQQYFAELVRTFSLFVVQERNPGEARATKMTFTNLPSGHDVGLETGSLFEIDGNVRIVRAFNPHLQGITGTGSVGSVSVTIS